ncbi:peptidoglycan recognition protein family protein [Nonomuraea sp. NPDC004702]
MELDGALGRRGRIYVIAAGRCWHNAPSTSPLHDNSGSIEIEAEKDGSRHWAAEQLDAYHRLYAELCKEFGLPARGVRGHQEVNDRNPTHTSSPWMTSAPPSPD